MILFPRSLDDLQKLNSSHVEALLWDLGVEEAPNMNRDSKSILFHQITGLPAHLDKESESETQAASKAETETAASWSP